MMQGKVPKSTISRLCWTILSVLFFILVNGYYVNCGDQEEHLPYVYKLLHPQLYQGDYLVPYQITHFTVRYFFAHLIAFFGKWFEVTDVVLFFYCLCLGVFSYITGKLAVKISRNESAFVVAQIFALTLFNNWTTGGNSIMDVQLTCTVFAATFGALSFYSGFRHRHWMMALFAGLASLFQVLVGLQVFLIVMFVMIGYDKTVFRLKNLVVTVGIYFLTAAPMLLPIFYHQFLSKQLYDFRLYDYILFDFRNAHHYIPAAFPLKDYLKISLIFLTAISILALGFYKEFRKFYSWMSLIIISGALIYAVVFGYYGVAAVGKLQWFKSTVWLSWASAIVISARICSFKMIDSIWNRFSAQGSLVALFFILVCSGFMLIGRNMHPSLAHRYNFNGDPISDYQKMHVYIRNNTPVDCCVLSTPDDDGFLCEAQRPTPVAWKGIIHEPWFMMNWYTEFRTAYGNGNSLSEATLNYRLIPDSLINLRIKPDLRVVDLSVKGPEIADSLILHREGNLVLLRFSQ